jgi:para-nitrobenzyl esterase
MSKKTLFAAGAVAMSVVSVAGLAWSQAQPPARGGATAPGRPVPAPLAPPDKDAPVVAVTGGKTAGGVYGDVAIYRGIPFAAPPVGDLRWRAPQPVKPWTDVRKGLEFGGTCTASEDCLYVNVYKPADAKPGAKLPVMVWIYGGSFTGGASNQYEGQSFAKKGIVYVSLNYRLGRTGWFGASAITKNAPKTESVGNFGLQDQIAALKWVQANVAKFGGDPKHVTAFGESAGGISVNYLMITPQAKGLFQQAISESGFNRHEPQPLGEADKRGDAYFAGQGITGDGPDALAKMRAVPFATLNATRIPLGGAGPINDGKLLVQGIEEGFEKGLDGKIPYMLGGNSNEASLFPTQDPPGRLAKIKAASPSVSAAYDSVGKGDATREVNAIVTDYYITEPDRAVARLHVKHGGPTYRYFMSYVTPNQRATALGMGHGGEIGYVFGRAITNPEDSATTEAANAYWAAFAKYGNPGAAGGAPWPKYDQTDPALEFGNDGLHARADFFKDRLDWNEKNRDVIVNSAPPLVAPVSDPAAASSTAAPARSRRGGN